ncbi:MAG: flagellar hook assembly protein FlgD [Alphaproteobacteria bacterium]
MNVNPIAAAAVSASQTSRTSLAGDFDTFLTLLTAQLSNQDPLDPLNSNEFVAQLVSFTGVEQAVNTNTNLEKLVDLFTGNQAAAAVGYLGTTVEAKGNAAVLGNGSASFDYSLPENAAATDIVIQNAQGAVVFTGNGEPTAGEHSFVWDGLDDNGVQQPDGTYTITVTARDAAGAPITVETRMQGRVTGVDTLDGELTLIVNGVPVPFSDVISVRESDPPPSA